MSRFDQDGPDDLDSLLAYGRWMGRRKAVLNGRPGKDALKELEQVLLQLPHKKLIKGGLCNGEAVCAMGGWLYRHWVEGGMRPKDAWKKLRSVGRQGKEPWGDSYEELERTIEAGSTELGITKTLAEVVAYINDEEGYFLWKHGDQQLTERYNFVLKKVRRYIEFGVP